MPFPKLRDYQENVIKNTEIALEKSERVLIVAGTGAGKTVISSSLIHKAIAQKKKVLFLVHRNVLIDQTLEEFKAWGMVAGVVAGAYPERPDHLVQRASCQTISRRSLDWFDFNLAVFDEAHITAFSESALSFFPKLRNNSTSRGRKLIGLTATPFRLNPQEKMGDIFESLVCAPVPKALIESNYLSKPVYYAIDTIKTSDLKVGKGKDFTKKDLEVRCNVPEVIESAVGHWQRLGAGRRTIAFTVGVAHANSLAEAFKGAGVAAAAVDGSMSRTERLELYQQLSSGQILVLCSCEALSEGFNVPAISCILLSRPTKSIAKFIQQLGRGLRLFPGKTDCIVLDQANLIHQFGYIEDLKEEDFSLDISCEEITKGEAPVKTCPACLAILYSFQMRCPKCAHTFPTQTKRMATGQLKRLLHPEDWEAFNFIQDGLKQAYEKGLHPDWAIYRYRERYGNRYLPQDWIRGAILGENPSHVQKERFRQYLTQIAQQKRIPLKWVEEQMHLHLGGT